MRATLSHGGHTCLQMNRAQIGQKNKPDTAHLVSVRQDDRVHMRISPIGKNKIIARTMGVVPRVPAGRDVVDGAHARRWPHDAQKDELGSARLPQFEQYTESFSSFTTRPVFSPVKGPGCQAS